MVVLSFSVKKEKVLMGEKTQTIRPHNPERVEQMARLGIQVYWKQRSAKNSDYLFDAELIGHDHIKFYKTVEGEPRMKMEVTGEWRVLGDAAMKRIARKDGFYSFRGLVDGLTDMYGEDEIYDMTFDVIRFTSPYYAEKFRLGNNVKWFDDEQVKK